MSRGGSRSGKKKNEPAPRVGPGSTYDSVPKNIQSHMQRYSNKIIFDMNTFNLKVCKLLNI